MSGETTYRLTHEQARAVALLMPLAITSAFRYLTGEDEDAFEEAMTVLRPATRGDGSTARSRPVSLMLRIVDQNAGHTTCTVWIGRTPGSRGNSGSLVIRTDEFDELVAQLGIEVDRTRVPDEQ